MLDQVYNEYAASLDTRDKFWHDRSKTVGASEIGSCSRQTFFVKFHGTEKGADIDPDFEHDFGARMRGVLMEESWFVPAMRAKFGSKFRYAGNNQKTLQRGYLSATPDGLLVDQPYDSLKHLGVKNIKSDCYMVEAKTVDPRTSMIEAKDKHMYQAQVQLGLMRELSPHKPEYNLLTYTDASFWSEVHEFAIQYDDFIYQAAHARAQEILEAKRARDLPPEGIISGMKECSFCPYVKACGSIRHYIPTGTKKASPQLAAEITDMAKQHNTITRVALKAEQDAKRISEDIRSKMQKAGVKRIENVVNIYYIKGQHRYRWKELRVAFAELGGDPEEFAYDGEPSSRVQIAAIPAAARVVKSTTRKSKRAKGKKQNGKAKRNAKRANVKRTATGGK